MRRFVLAALMIAVAARAHAQTPQVTAQRFSLGYLPYSPGSTIDAKMTGEGNAPGGPYQVFMILRSSIKGKDIDQMGLILDPSGRQIAAGYAFPIPPYQPPVDAQNLPQWVESGFADLLYQILNARVKVRWQTSPMRQTAVIPVSLQVNTGYGMVSMPAAVTGDGKYFILGSTWPIDRDPRAVRRDLIANAAVQWDGGGDKATVKVVEFSDFQCPACKRGWAITKPVWDSFKGKVRHGLVNNPLWSNHPWAFRAAAAGQCVGRLWPDHLLELKEEFYRLQDTITVSSVDDVATGFLDQHGLDRKAFLACFMKDPVVNEVIASLELGYRLGVMGTPTYYANGEGQPFGDGDWITKRLQAIIDAKGIPENASEIKVTPTPAAAATPAAGTAAPAKPAGKPSTRR